MPVATGAAMIDLGNDVAEAVIAVRIDRRHRADAAGRRPGAGTGMVGNGHPLAAFDQWPDFPAAVNDGLQPLEQRNLPRKKFRGPQPHEGRPIAALRSDEDRKSTRLNSSP